MARPDSAPMQKLMITPIAMVLTSLTGALAAAPMGYSINADSPTGNADSLYRIDLATGEETRIAQVRALGQVRIDVEGLAFAEDGTLYAVDDDTLTTMRWWTWPTRKPSRACPRPRSSAVMISG